MSNSNYLNSPNPEKPLIMHVDLNSAFATIEQQSRPLLRGRPVAVLNRRTERTSIVAASYEAKAFGVKVGMKFAEAARLVPGLVALESDPTKYRFVYHQLLRILNDYSPRVVMKSIDEGVMDFHDLPTSLPLIEIGYDIKRRLKEEVGVAMRCNVGIGPNRFLAKLAADLHKPDGLDVISADNLREVYSTLKLTDLTGIAKQMEKKLNAVGVFTPLEFLDTSEMALEKVAFKSIIGGQWFRRLRGYEVDDLPITTKTIGRQYVLEDRSLSREEILVRFHNLCESVGSRLRCQKKAARGLRIYVRTLDHQYWHACKMSQLPFFSDKTIYYFAQNMFRSAPENIIEIGLSCYGLTDNNCNQVSLFGDEIAREMQVASVIDEVNERFGERTIHSADTLYSDGIVKQKIPFGSTRYL